MRPAPSSYLPHIPSSRFSPTLDIIIIELRILFNIASITDWLFYIHSSLHLLLIRFNPLVRCLVHRHGSVSHTGGSAHVGLLLNVWTPPKRGPYVLWSHTKLLWYLLEFQGYKISSMAFLLTHSHGRVLYASSEYLRCLLDITWNRVFLCRAISLFVSYSMLPTKLLLLPLLRSLGLPSLTRSSFSPTCSCELLPCNLSSRNHFFWIHKSRIITFPLCRPTRPIFSVRLSVSLLRIC